MTDEYQGPIVTSHIDFPVVGIGASAGGLAALQRFLEQMPADNGMAFVVVIHLSPKHESNLGKILQNVTRMPVTQVADATPIEKNNVYVIPPSKDLLMQDGKLIIKPADRPRGRHVAIDLFFRTLAEVHRARAIGIVMSGTGSDGSVGITRIKDKGGVTMVQALFDAEYDGMPCSAIETGVVDFVLPAVEMPQKLIEIARNAEEMVLPRADELRLPVNPETSEEGMRASEDALRAIMHILRVRTGHDFTYYKQATVLRRIERRMQINCVKTLAEYHAYLEAHLDETPPLLQDMLISVTNFFRDREGFEALERDVIPRMFEGVEAGTQIRAWTVGCATGEEAYSVAMLLAEQRLTASLPADIQVFGTDIDDRAISVARRGLYPESILTDVPPSRLRQFFAKQGNHYQIKKEIREKVLFAAHNILRDPPFSRIHLITCRNLLIYLDRSVQQKIFEMFHFSLLPGGYLFLGSSESAEMASDYFVPVDKKNRIYRASPRPHSHYVPALPFRQTSAMAPVRLGTADAKPKVRYADVHQRLVVQYAPPSVLVNQNGDIVHLSEKAGAYLRHQAGEPSHNLLMLVLPELRLELRTALFQVTQTGNEVETQFVPLLRDERPASVSLLLRPVGEDNPGSLVLVLFKEIEAEPAREPAQTDDAHLSFVTHQLEKELHVTKEQLQSTIEQYETSSEELKASNEELQAINEELRSTTEELETSKEELQSINEELITVNYELKMKVDETSKTNDDLQNFIAATEIATIFVDRGLLIKRYTPRAADIFNLIPGDIGRPLLNITHCLEYSALEEDADAVINDLRPIEREVAGNNGNWYIARLIPYRTLEDKIDGLVLTFIDISSLHQAQNKLREEERRMRLVAASTRDYAIITQDLDGCITSWNNGAQRIFGYEEQEVVGRHVSLIFTPEDLARGAPEEEMLLARTVGRSEDERWHVRKDGSRFFCSGVLTPLDDGEMHGYAKIARDLTGLKQAETLQVEMLARETATRHAAENASRMREEFLAILSHELKQPLNLIHLNAELLKRMPEVRDSQRVARIAETIRNTTISQATLIDDLLDLSRVRTGKLRLNKTRIDLADTVRRITDAFADDAKNKGVKLVNATAEASIPIDADATRVEQIVWNLLSNAIKFTPAGGNVRVAVATEGSMACLTVNDTGQGIAPEFLPYIFEMFSQAQNSTTREHGGLGIGLALVRQLAESHGGSARAISAGYGAGAEFRICLPLLDTAAGDGESEGQFETDVSSCLIGKRLLLIDDDEGTLGVFGDLLRSHGAQLSLAHNPAEALREAENKSFDLIVSDIGMPGMDGYQLLTELRKKPNAARTPIIAMSGFGRMVDVERALKAGFAAHMQKPIVFDVFVRTVNALLNEKSNIE